MDNSPKTTIHIPPHICKMIDNYISGQHKQLNAAMRNRDDLEASLLSINDDINTINRQINTCRDNLESAKAFVNAVFGVL